MAEQKQLHVEVSQDMLDSTNSDPDFMNTIITDDKSWVYGYDQSFHHFPYKENPIRALNTTSSNAACHQLTLLTGRMKFTDAYEGSRLPHASMLHWNPPGFHKKKSLDTFLTDLVFESFLYQFQCHFHSVLGSISICHLPVLAIFHSVLLFAHLVFFFFQFFTSLLIVNGFFLLVEDRNAAQVLCFYVLLHYFQFIARILWISFFFFFIENYCIVLMGQSLLPNALRPFKDLL